MWDIVKCVVVMYNDFEIKLEECNCILFVVNSLLLVGSSLLLVCFIVGCFMFGLFWLILIIGGLFYVVGGFKFLSKCLLKKREFGLL